MTDSIPLPWLMEFNGRYVRADYAIPLMRAVEALPPMTDEQVQRCAELLMASNPEDS